MTQIRRRLTVVVLGLLCLIVSTAPAAAQAESRLPSPDMLVGDVLQASPSAAVIPTPAQTLPAPRRSLTLPTLQVSYAALQVMDVLSTARALNAGLQEGNVAMKGIVGQPMALAAIKGGAAVATILITNRVARKNRAVAIATMLAVNTAYSVVVARNIRAVGQN